MAFKVSNEVKVGAITAIAITLLILGFNFLKGNNPLKKSQYIFAKFTSIEGLVPANPVLCNGLVVGTVYKVEPGDELLNTILVTIRISEPILIPNDSKATIKGNLLSTPAVSITKGISTVYLDKGDTIKTENSSGFMAEILEKLGPTQESLNNSLGQLDTLLSSTNEVLDEQGKDNLKLTLSNLTIITGNLAKTTQAINSLLSQQNNSFTKTMENLAQTSQQIKDGTQNLPAITGNLEKATQKFSELELKATIENLNGTLTQLKNTLATATNPDGSIGALMNDRKLYDNLTSTVNSLNLLMQDLRLNPKRYVNVSVFGKKDKSQPLMKPMEEDSITQEQFRNQ